jgi:hypothetical protein
MLKNIIIIAQPVSTIGSKTVMDVIGFLCVSLGSRCVCACSEVGFSSQNGDHHA